MEKQTAVEWLFEMLNNPKNDQVFAKKLLNKAKEMEKDQLMNSWVKGVISDGNKTAEQYYNETFKTK